MRGLNDSGSVFFDILHYLTDGGTAMIKKFYVYGHWEIYRDRKFLCSCEDSELSAVMKELG